MRLNAGDILDKYQTSEDQKAGMILLMNKGEEEKRMVIAILLTSLILDDVIAGDNKSSFIVAKIALDINEMKGISNVEISQYFYDNYDLKQMHGLYKHYKRDNDLLADIKHLTNEEIRELRAMTLQEAGEEK